MTESPEEPIRIRLASARDTDDLHSAIALGNESRMTLGHLPYAAYADAAERGGLLLAVDASGEDVGYALFALTDRHIRLTHLCVSSRHRGRGIGRHLVDWISERHRDRPGILVWCRRDYGLGQMWSRLGFERLEERRGRGLKATILVAWWKDHGHPKLFTARRDGVVVRAALDLNVVRDLVDKRRTNSEESLALISDQLADRLELVRTAALDLEIDRMDDDLRVPCARWSAGLHAVQSPEDASRISEAILRVAADAIDPAFSKTPQGEMDMRYASEAIAAGLNVLVTRDERMTAVLGEAAAGQGLRILRPAEVVVRIDELVRAEAYRPGSIQATAFTRMLIPAGREASLELLVGRRTSERLPELRSRVRDLTARGLDRVGVFAPGGELVAAYVENASQTVLDLPIFRIADGPLAATFARQLLFGLRREAVGRGLSVLRLSDPHLSRTVVAAAADDGYVEAGDGMVALVIDACGPASVVHEAAAKASRVAALPPPARLREGLASPAAAEVERVWWPAKVLDSLLPSYVIPIQQRYSRELLGAPRGLFARDAGLGLSREHVYYRSSRGLKLVAPARLAWYMSMTSRGSVERATIVAVSLLEEIVEDTPERLHDRFRHLGVWNLAQLQQVARGGVVQALRFANTETFDKPIALSLVRRVLGAAPQGPMSVASTAFAELYMAGHARV